jgi:hypothetical protein
VERLIFKELEPNKKTKRFLVETKRGFALGEIRWKDPWVGYGMYANPGVVLGTIYLSELAEFVDKLNKE